jgi:phage terminase small subunit
VNVMADKSTKKSTPKSVEMINVEMEGSDRLNPKQSAFLTQYLIDFNGKQAAIRAGYSEHSAEAIASELLSFPKVKAALGRRMAAAADAAEVNAELVISELYQLALANPSELMRIEVDCCRHCHGVNHKYHWTEPEYLRALAAADKAGKPAPDVEGFFGFDPRLEPHPECPDCWGRGVDRVVVTPSKKLSRAASRLLASMKATKDGIEIKVHDQLAALLALGKVTGALRDRTELTGPNGSPLQLQPVQPLEQLSPEQLEAIIRASGHPVLQGYPIDKPLTPTMIEAITGGTTK